MKNAEVHEIQGMRPRGFGNRLYSEYGLVASIPHPTLLGEAKSFDVPVRKIYANTRVVDPKSIKILNMDPRDFSEDRLRQL
jgi:hypothetical protein